MKSMLRISICVLILAISSGLSANGEAIFLKDNRVVNLPPLVKIAMLNFIDFGAFNPNLALNGTLISNDTHGGYTFDFEDLNETGNVLSAVPDVEPLNNISTLDLVKIHKGLLFEDLTPLESIAADVDRSGSVTTKELVTIRKLILGIENSDLAGQPFLIRKNADLSGLDMFDFVNDYDKYIFDKAEVEGVAELEFEIFQYANVSDAKSEFHKSDISTSPLSVFIENQMISKGDVITVPILLTGQSGDIQGAGFKLSHPQLELIDITSGVYESEMMTNELDPTATVLSYLPQKPTEELLIELTFKAKASGNLSSLLQMNNEYANELISDGYQLNNLTLQYESSLVRDSPISVYPNPVHDVLFIDALTVAQAYDITITDMLGRQVYQGQISDEVLALDQEELNAKGMLLVHLSSQTDQIVKKVMIP